MRKGVLEGAASQRTAAVVVHAIVVMAKVHTGSEAAVLHFVVVGHLLHIVERNSETQELVHIGWKEDLQTVVVDMEKHHVELEAVEEEQSHLIVLVVHVCKLRYYRIVEVLMVGKKPVVVLGEVPLAAAEEEWALT